MGSQSRTSLSDWTELNWEPSSVKDWRTKLNQHNVIYSFKMLYIHVACLLQLMSCWWYIAAKSKLLQSCPTLCDPRDSSPPGSPNLGILQVRTLEWVAISFSNAWKWKVKVKSLSHVRLLATPWTATYQAPLSMGFSRQEYWSGVPLPSPACIPREI